LLNIFTAEYLHVKFSAPRLVKPFYKFFKQNENVNTGISRESAWPAATAVLFRFEFDQE
jgi:hypothetical protein